VGCLFLEIYYAIILAMNQPKDISQAGAEGITGGKTLRQSEQAIIRRWETSVAPIRRASLTEPEKREVRTFLALAFRPLELIDDSYDEIVPTSLEAVSELVDTGFLPSRSRGGFITSFQKAEVAFDAMGGNRGFAEEAMPLHLRPLFEARSIARNHGILAELDLHQQLNLPQDDPDLWDHIIHPRNRRYLRDHGLSLDDVKQAIEGTENFQGILLGIKGSAEDPDDNGDISYRRVAAIIGIGSDNKNLAEYLGISERNPALHTQAYTFEGKAITEDVPVWGKWESGERTTREVPFISVFFDLEGWGKWKLLSAVAETNEQGTEGATVDLVEGFFNTPSYQRTTETDHITIPEFNRVYLRPDTGHFTHDPLLTKTDITAFYERHSDRYPETMPQQVIEALFSPYESIADDLSLQLPQNAPPLFNQWKKARIHLWHFKKAVPGKGTEDELGIATSTISQAITRGRLLNIQGLEQNGQVFLSDLLTELNTIIEPELDKQQTTSLLNYYLKYLKKIATVTDDGTSVIKLKDGQEVQVAIRLPSLERTGELAENGEETKDEGIFVMKEDHESGIRAKVLLPEGELHFLVTNNHGRDPQLTTLDEKQFADALKAAAVALLIPKAILDIYGSYEEFKAYMQRSGKDWDDSVPEGSSETPLYLEGLEAMVNKLKNRDAATVVTMQTMQTLAGSNKITNKALTTMADFDPDLLENAA
jgi:hypothetical protein